MANSRTKNVSLNVAAALICQGINLIINFVLRTLFIKTLGAEYLGVNGLFTNILSILSFAELGIGNAIVYSMYKPLATGDREKINSLMGLYKKAYTTIALIVLICGLLVVPFLGLLVKDTPDVHENITLLYLLFLVNTVSSYLFVYKKSIIIADQKNYIALIITQGMHIIQTAVQIVILYTTHNYILFLSIKIICTFLGNIIAGFYANRMYPYLKSKAQKLSKSETKSIFRNVRDLAMYKFGSVILNGTDNILVSSLINVTQVGYVSNYALLTSACNSILGNITSAFTASVGNLNVAESKEKKYEVFKKMLFITSWIYGFASVGLITIVEYLIPVWIGKDYLLSRVTSIAIVTGFYVHGVHSVESTYRMTLGYFKRGRFAPAISAIVNLVLSVVLCKIFGLAGIFIATPIARAVAIGIVDSYLIFSDNFKMSPLIYYRQYFAYFGLFICIGVLCDFIISFVSLTGWIGLIVRILIVTVIFNTIMLVIFGRTKMFKELYHALFRILGSKFKKA